MKKAVLLAVAGGVVAAITGGLALTAQKAETSATPDLGPSASTRILVYYFHATVRCATCRRIEAYALETVTTRFAADIAARRLAWLAVNVDEPPNRHFIRDFRLYTRSVVVVDANDPRRYKVLDRVWPLSRDKEAFQRYVEQEIRAFPRP